LRCTGLADESPSGNHIFGQAERESEIEYGELPFAHVLYPPAQPG